MLLLEHGTHVGVEGIHGKKDGSTRFRVSQYRDVGKEKLCTAEGRVKNRGPRKRYTQTL